MRLLKKAASNKVNVIFLYLDSKRLVQVNNTCKIIVIFILEDEKLSKGEFGAPILMVNMNE